MANDSAVGKDGPSPWVEANFEGSRPVNGTDLQALVPQDDSEDRKPRLQLGMMGVGGYGAGKDNIGWHGNWPDFHDNQKQERQNSMNRTLDCCSDSTGVKKPQSSAKKCCEDQSTHQSAAVDMPSSNYLSIAAPPLNERPGLTPSQDQPWSHDIVSVPNDDTFSFGLVQQMGKSPRLPEDYNAAMATICFPATSMQRSISGPQATRQAGSNTNQNVSTSDFTCGQDGSIHTCYCGDSCQCFGCPTHPNNDTTRSRMQELDLLMTLNEHDNDSDRSNSRPHTAIGDVSATQTLNSTTSMQSMFWNPYNSNISSISYDIPNNLPNGVDTANGLITSNGLSASKGLGTPNGFDTFSSSGQRLYQNDPSIGMNYGQGIMSASAYVTVEYPLGTWNNCTNYLGGCLCGGDCRCIGCLTHSGHNGVPLNSPGIGLVHSSTQTYGSDLNLHQPSAITNGFPHSQLLEGMNMSSMETFHETSNVDREPGFVLGRQGYHKGHT
jgi:hypothetical protein